MSTPWSSAPPEDWRTYRRYLYLLPKLLFYLLVGFLVWLVLRQAQSLITMLFLSLLAAYVLDPLVDWFEARGFSRTVAILVLVVSGIGVAVGFFFWMVPTLVRGLSGVGHRVGVWVSGDHSALTDWLGQMLGIHVGADLVADASEKLREYAPQILGRIGQFLSGAVAGAADVAAWVLNAVMVPIFVFYFLRDFDRLKSWVEDALPRPWRDQVVARAGRVDSVVGSWIRGQIQVALVLAVLYAVGLAAIGVPLGVPIGILAGLVNVIPYLGFAFGFGLSLLMVLLEWQGVGLVIGVAVVFTVVQIVESYVLTPWIVGERVGLSPVMVIIVLLAGGEVFGLMGVVLAVPVAGAVKTMMVEVMDWYRTSEAYLGPKESVP